QKISLSTFLTVLKCASLRELWIAAKLTLYYFKSILNIVFSKNVFLIIDFLILLLFYFFEAAILLDLVTLSLFWTILSVSWFFYMAFHYL
ncbi:hypothetical protein EO96_01230, partial [Methanosarcina sp. 2.H.T.1A.8]